MRNRTAKLRPSRLNKSCFDRNVFVNSTRKKRSHSPLGISIYDTFKSPPISPSKSPRISRKDSPNHLKSFDDSFINTSECERPKISINNEAEISVKGSQTIQAIIRSPRSQNHHNHLYSIIMNFQTYIIKKYKHVYFEIDANSTGFISYRDVCNFVSKKINHNCSKVIEELWNCLYLVSNKPTISKSEFFSMCSVVEHNKIGKLDEFDSLEVKFFLNLKYQINELRELFYSFSNGSRIDNNMLKEKVDKMQNNEEILRIASLLTTSAIEFTRFLRFLPFFIYLYKNSYN